MRPIDADALIDFLDIVHLRHSEYLSFSEVEVANLLLHAPTVNTVLVPRCCDCNNRNDEEKCPMCHTEEVIFDDDDGYIEYESWINDKTDDNGFCHKWEGMVTSDGNV